MPSKGDTWVLWERGLRAPTITTLHNRGSPPSLTDRETKQQLATVRKLADDEHGLTLDVLAKIYPLTVQKGGG